MSNQITIQFPVASGNIVVVANSPNDLVLATHTAVKYCGFAQAFYSGRVADQVVDAPPVTERQNPGENADSANDFGPEKFFYNYEYQSKAKFFPGTGLKLHSQALGSLCGRKITATNHTDGQRLQGTLSHISVGVSETRCDVVFDGWNHSRSVSLSDVQFVENE